MTPLTLILDRRFPGLGRIKRASGTTVPQVKRKLDRMLTALYEDGRLDILRAIRDGQLTALEVHDAYQRRELHKLPTAATVKPLAVAMQKWITSLTVPADCSAKHKQSLETSRRYFKAASPKATVADLPRVLDKLRESLGAKHPRSFNLARSAALAFVRSTLKRSNPLWLACAAVEPRRSLPRVKRSPLTPAQMRGFFPNVDSDPTDAIAWGMATSGMGGGEYWGAWEIRADRLHIVGTKRAGRVRDVPLIHRPAVPTMHRRTWENKVRERTRTITAYDLRRTYANWLESAGIPRTRRKLYLGHKAADVTDLYERHEVDAFLADDATKLRTFLGLPSTIGHTMTLHTTEGAQ